MTTFKILLQTNNNKSEFVSEYKSIDAFNKWKSTRLLTNCKYIKYSMKEKGEFMYSKPVTEYGTNRNKTINLETKKTINSIRKNIINNQIQKKSRNNHIALVGNDLINLSMTPQKQSKLMKWIDSGVPITSNEVRKIKSIMCSKKLTLGQYAFIKQIKDTVSKRVKV